MALNDLERPRNGLILNLTAAIGEASTNVATSSKAGRAPVTAVKLRSQGTMRVGFKTGGPYYNLIANEVIDLGSFGPGDPASIFYIRTGGADVPFDLIIWN